MLSDPRIFPTIIMVLSAFAAMASAFNHDVRGTLYWAAATTITAVVTW
jgi:hypothetical protein